MASRSSGETTAPEGLDGVLRMMALVLGVMAASIIARGDAEVLRLVRLDVDGHAAGVLDDVLEGDPVGDGEDDLVAVIDEDLDGVEEGELAAGGEDALVEGVVGAEVGMRGARRWPCGLRGCRPRRCSG